MPLMLIVQCPTLHVRSRRIDDWLASVNGVPTLFPVPGKPDSPPLPTDTH